MILQELIIIYWLRAQEIYIFFFYKSWKQFRLIFLWKLWYILFSGLFNASLLNKSINLFLENLTDPKRLNGRVFIFIFLFSTNIFPFFKCWPPKSFKLHLMLYRSMITPLLNILICPSFLILSVISPLLLGQLGHSLYLEWTEKTKKEIIPSF